MVRLAQLTLPPSSPPGAPPPRLTRALKPLHIGPLKVDPPILQAPMAGFTNFVYRQIVREFGGAGLQATEMISAEGFVRMTDGDGPGGGIKGAPERLWGVKDEPRPLAVQMWDNDPETLAEVGRRLTQEYGVSVVDLNFGCPVRKITKAHSGSYLLTDPSRMHAIIARVRKACEPTPVTAKIRLGCTHGCVTAFEVAKAVEEAGSAALTVHGRVAEQFFKGAADWDTIGEIKTRLKAMPLIGNGDMNCAARVVEAFNTYDVDGVMIARAALSRPWLFREAAAALRNEEMPAPPTPAEEKALLRRHHNDVVAHFGEERGTVLMRKYACTYAQGRSGARVFRTHVSKMRSSREFHEIVERWYPKT